MPMRETISNALRTSYAKRSGDLFRHVRTMKKGTPNSYHTVQLVHVKIRKQRMKAVALLLAAVRIGRMFCTRGQSPGSTKLHNAVVRIVL